MINDKLGAGGEVKTVWVVRDWQSGINRKEMCWPATADHLARYIRRVGEQWDKEHTQIFMDRQSAEKETERRLEAVDKLQALKGRYRHEAEDGRIVYVSIPEDEEA